MNLHSSVKLVVSTLLIVSYAVIARADDIQPWFVPIDRCAPRTCTCFDIPTLQLFLSDQTRARDAWKSIKADIVAGRGPTTSADARTLFNTRFGAASAAISTQYKTCAGYDPTKNDPTKVAGLNSSGVPVFDPCFCGAFCSDVIQATLAHEKMHVTSGIILTAGSLHLAAFCKLVSHPECAKLEPLLLATSEVVSHDAGIAALDQAIQRLQAATEDCTTDAGAITPPPPPGLLPRAQQLFSRFVHGAIK
jgi:hypothetical protein